MLIRARGLTSLDMVSLQDPVKGVGKIVVWRPDKTWETQKEGRPLTGSVEFVVDEVEVEIWSG